jgi:hypothetical protein
MCGLVSSAPQLSTLLDQGSLIGSLPITALGVELVPTSVSRAVIRSRTWVGVSAWTPRISSTDWPTTCPSMRDDRSLEPLVGANSRVLVPGKCAASFPWLSKINRMQVPSISTKRVRAGHSEQSQIVFSDKETGRTYPFPPRPMDCGTSPRRRCQLSSRIAF